jgi:signal transduction histidine kinase
VRFFVHDSGPGLDVQDAPHIFERFYQGQGASAGGSGLGLAIARSVVQAHGGQIWAESGPGGGSTFVVELPVR